MLRESLDRGRINRGRSGSGSDTRPWQDVEIDRGRGDAGKAEKASEGGEAGSGVMVEDGREIFTCTRPPPRS